eukprot:TRINITY_DN636_c0_g1_i6.p1 TRINITY_DN636_c0_g1~~TRINITY_DN636_c0_g1_i6.p1  ORF type:complete len:1161 (+),score=207.94 TRINITY_DN636_c0_g1_i6:56-3538(+)
MSEVTVSSTIIGLCVACVIVSAAVTAGLGIHMAENAVTDTEDAYRKSLEDSIADIEDAVMQWAGQLLAASSSLVRESVHTLLLRQRRLATKTASVVEGYPVDVAKSWDYLRDTNRALKEDLYTYNSSGLVANAIITQDAAGLWLSQIMVLPFTETPGVFYNIYANGTNGQSRLLTITTDTVPTHEEYRTGNSIPLDLTDFITTMYHAGHTSYDLLKGVHPFWTDIQVVSSYAAFFLIHPYAFNNVFAGVVIEAVDIRLITKLLKALVTCDHYHTSVSCLNGNPTCGWNSDTNSCEDVHNLHIFAVIAGGANKGILAGASHEDLPLVSQQDIISQLELLIPKPRLAVEAQDNTTRLLAQHIEGKNDSYAQAVIEGTQIVTMDGQAFVTSVSEYNSRQAHSTGNHNAGDGIHWWIVQSMTRETLLKPLLGINQKLEEGMVKTHDEVTDNRTKQTYIGIAIVLVIVIIMGALSIVFAKTITDHLRQLEREMHKAGMLQLEEINPFQDSMLSEILSMQRSFRLMINYLTEHRAYVPQAVLHGNQSRSVDTNILLESEEEVEGDNNDNDNPHNVLELPSKRDSGFESTKIQNFSGSPTSAMRRLQLGLRIRVASVLIVEDFRVATDLEMDSMSQTFVRNTLELIRAGDGTVIQLCADSCLASWNTHRSDPRHAVHACYTGMTLCNMANVGIDTSRFLVGSIGDRTTRTIAVTGPAIGVCKRLPTLVLKLGLQAAITEETYDRAKMQITARCVDSVSVNGSSFLIYELLAAQQKNEEVSRQAASVTEAFNYIVQGKPVEALSILRGYVEGHPHDNQGTRLLKLAMKDDSVENYCRKYIGWESHEGGEDWSKEKDGHETSTVTAVPSVLVDGGVGAIEKQLKEATNLVPGGALPRSFVDQAGAKWQRSEKSLGKGAYGSVWAGMGEDGGLVALKTIPVPTCADSAKLQSKLASLLGELRMLSNLRNDCIVAYIGSGLCEGYIIMAMEYLPGGSLYSLLREFGPLPIPSATRYLKDILRGLKFLHKQGIVHRDMKPHNVLLLVDGQCKLADFGASCDLSALQNATGPIVGTPVYMSPEAAKGCTVAASDIWATGITLIQILTGKLPYNLPTPFQTRAFLKSLSMEEVFPMIPNNMPEVARDFASKCFTRIPENRCSAEDLLLHSMFWG